MWEDSKERVELYKEIEPLLEEKPKVSVFRVAATEGEENRLACHSLYLSVCIGIDLARPNTVLFKN